MIVGSVDINITKNKLLADNAQNTADNAYNAIVDMSNDDKLTPVEKQTLMMSSEQITKEKAYLDDMATSYSLTNDVSYIDYVTAYDTLYDYMAPLLTDLTTTSDIIGATLRSHYANYHEKVSIFKKVVVDSIPAYTHIAYATNSTGTTGFSTTDSTDKTYIGIYVGKETESPTDPTVYKWTLIKGADGAQGLQGPKGADGRTPYFHTAYATNSTGTTGFSTTDATGKTYIGTYTDYTSADSTDPTKYTWQLVQGPQGVRGPEAEDPNLFGLNSSFYDWEVGQTLPTGYTAGSGNTPSKAVSDNKNGNSIYFTVDAGSECYIYKTVYNVGYSKYVQSEITFKLHSGTLSGAGIIIRADGDSQYYKYIALSDYVPNPVLGKWYTINLMLDLIPDTTPSGWKGYTIFIMAGSINFGTISAKTISFDAVKVKPASSLFVGKLVGATGDFSGNLTAQQVLVGPTSFDQVNSGGYSDVMKLKIPFVDINTGAVSVSTNKFVLGTGSGIGPIGLYMQVQDINGDKVPNGVLFVDMGMNVSGYSNFDGTLNVAGDLYSDNVHILGSSIRNDFDTLYLRGYYGDGSDFSDLSLGKDSTGPRVYSTATYARTYSNDANMFITSAGTFGRSTSARKYKLNDQVAEDVIAHAKEVLNINPSKWYDKAETETIAEGITNGDFSEVESSMKLQFHYGFIADDFHDRGLTEVVEYDENGDVDSLAYSRISMYHNVILKEHEERISQLEANNADLKQRIEALEKLLIK